MTSTLTHPHSPAAATAGAHRCWRVLAVLSPNEMAEFFPGTLQQGLHALGEYTLANTDELRGPALEAFIHSHNPDVILAGWSTPQLPDALPSRLRYVCYVAGSVRRTVTRRHLEQGLIVTNWAGSIARTVAEAALMMLLMGFRRAGKWNTAMHRDAAWAGWQEKTWSLFNRRIGLHGFGNMARELTRLLAPFSARVSAFDPYVTDEVFAELRVERCADLPSLFSENDAVVVAAALVPETMGVINADLLRRLPPHGVFVNVSRGQIVDEASLVQVARDGRLQIGLDVYHHEPLPPDHPFRGLENVVLMPHLAGPTSDRRCDAGAHAIANLRRFAAGDPLVGLITPENYDRAT